MLFNEPKLLKWLQAGSLRIPGTRFSALQRAEIAEIAVPVRVAVYLHSFSALQRAEIAEIPHQQFPVPLTFGFSALQRAEIAEIRLGLPKRVSRAGGFSALQRAEIAEIAVMTRW